jgi:BirA family biotin operon repressor/biotin-[acetyl-CoA-carboxylase] ligase
MKRFFYPYIESTNTEAKRLYHKESAQPPYWIVTDHQTMGRGYGTNTWESAAGQNFCGTYTYLPHGLPAHLQFHLSQNTCLAIKKFCELYVEDVKIKWPNDIYCGDKKIAGILIENEILGDTISCTFIGIGMNVNQSKFLSDAPNPTSLRIETGLSLDLVEISDLLTEMVSDQLRIAESGDSDKIEEEYLKSLYRYKQFAPFRARDRWFEARIIGIGEFGELMLEEKSGKCLQFGFKEVEFIQA